MENTTEIASQVTKETELQELRDRVKTLLAELLAVLQKLGAAAGHDYKAARTAIGAAVGWVEAHF